MLFADDERDEDLDNDADADDDNNSDEDNDEDSDDDEQDESDDLDDLDDDESDEDDEENDDDKPVTKKELRDALKGNKNNRNADRRRSSKNRPNKNSSESGRLDKLEEAQKQGQLSERKRDFGHENSLSPKQTNYVFKLTKRPTPKFLNKPHVKAALDSIKSQEGVRANTPSSSGRGPRPNSGKKWSEQSSSEKQSGFSDRRREILERNR